MMETKQIINGLLDRADRVADQSAGRIMRQAAERLRELDEKQRWIPVTERLPDERYVLVSAINDVGEAVYDGHGQFYWINSDEYAEPLIVTHWMPLPEPPKEVE